MHLLSKSEAQKFNIKTEIRHSLGWSALGHPYVLRHALTQRNGRNNGRRDETVESWCASGDEIILSGSKPVLLETQMRAHAGAILQGRPLKGLNKAQR